MTKSKRLSPAEWLKQNPVPETPAGDEVVYWDFTPENPVEEIDHKLHGAAPAAAAERDQLAQQTRIAQRRHHWFDYIRAAYERRGNRLIMYSDVALWLKQRDPSLDLEKLKNLLINSVRLGGLRKGRDLLDLTGSAGTEPIPAGKYRLRPDLFALQINPFFMTAPVSIWAAWLTLKGLPVPEEWAPNAPTEPATEHVLPSGIRTTREQDAEQACGEYLAKWAQEYREGKRLAPASVAAAEEEAKAAVQKAGPLSNRAFLRQWGNPALPKEWHKSGPK
jgi:hypothetical protein